MTNGLDGVVSFYDELASSYDAMTAFRARFDRERPAFGQFVEFHRIKSAIDAGTGTGFHAILLAQLGVDVTAVDVSEGMLARSRENAHAEGVSIDTRRGSFAEVHRMRSSRVDGVFCLGNSFAHLSSEQAVTEALQSFHAALNPGGIVVIQVVNFQRILASRQRIQNVREVDGRIFIRFYDFLPQAIGFNLLTVDRTGSALRHHLSSVTLTPVLAEPMIASMNHVGFSSARAFGNISAEPYDAERSPDLVLMAIRGV